MGRDIPRDWSNINPRLVECSFPAFSVLSFQFSVCFPLSTVRCCLPFPSQNFPSPFLTVHRPRSTVPVSPVYGLRFTVHSSLFTVTAVRSYSARNADGTSSEFMGRFNDLDLDNWRELDINTDSLWLIGDRAKTGKHKNIYHGNFIPQIPNQLIRR